jgi:glycosyltransferase involved in cell wall biosynthesis
MIASVIIATRDRADQLDLALRSLAGMAVPEHLTWELIVVDDGSTDTTRNVTRQYEGTALPVRYMATAGRGKSHGLNAGLQVATGDVIAFTDDDCVVAEDWLAATVAQLTDDPSLAAIGGRVELHDPRDQPVTIRTQRHRESFTPARMLALIVGCNMAFRRTALERAGVFDETLGPGSRCCAAEDFDLLYRVHRCGLRVDYVPDVVVYHNHGRRTEADVRRLYARYGVSVGAFYGKHALRGDRAMFAMAVRHAGALLAGTALGVLGGGRRGRANRIRVRDMLTGAALQVGPRFRTE